MTAKKKTWSYNPLSHDSDHADGGLSGLANLGLTPLAPSTPPAAASMVAKVATWAAADASSTPGSVAAAVLPYTGNTPPPPPPSVAPVDANVEPLAASAQKVAPLAPTVTDKVSKVYQHWADGDFANPSDDEWNNNILSANKSDYSEGEVIPHVFAFKASSQTPLVPGQTYSFNITYNHYQANTNAGGFVGLDTFNLSRDPNSWPANGAPSADSTFVNGGGTAGMFHTVNADIISVSPVTYSSSNQVDGKVTVTFKYTGDTPTSGGSALIYYGLKIAGPGDVPPQSGTTPTLGAHMWTGGSLQTTVDIGGSGATSIQLSPAAILVPELTIDKTVLGVYESDGVTLDSDGIADEAGDIIKYNVKVTNTGEVQLTGVGVTDPLTGQNVTGVTLAVGASANYASQYTVQQSDLDNRGGGDNDIDNTATADSDQTAPTSDSAAAPLAYTPALNVDKVFEEVTDGNQNGIADNAGDVLRYSVVVRNTGNVTLTGVTVVDPLTGQNLSGITLLPGETQSFASSYTLTQADLDNEGGGDGDLDNTATADSDQTDSTSDSEAVPLAYLPLLAIAKSYDSVTGGNDNDKIDLPGEVLHYTVVVTNTGNITLTGVTVSDPLTGQNISGVTLAPGASQTYHSTYMLTQADLDNNGGGDGDIDNTATADSNETALVSDSAFAPLDFIPALAITKTFIEVTDGNGNNVADAAGDVIHYRVTVTNTDGQSLTNVTIVDPLTGQNLSGITLAAGESQSYDSQYTLTQSDLDTKGGGDGDLDNTATADSDQTDPVSDSEEVPLVYAPGMLLYKDIDYVGGGNGDAVANAVGDVIHYKVTVSNVGNITLSQVTVTDPLTGLDISGVSVAPGAVKTFDATYVLTQDDLDGNGGGDGDIDNTATADSAETDPMTASAAEPLEITPVLSLDKHVVGVTGGNGNTVADAVDDILNYTLTVKNLGNITLTNVSILDPFTGPSQSLSSLAPGGSYIWDTSYKLTQDDLDKLALGPGQLYNMAEAWSDQTGVVADGEEVPVLANPVLYIDKASTGVTGGNGNIFADAKGDIINFRVTVINQGNVTLTDVLVQDALGGINDTIASLAPGAQMVYDTAYTLTQEDIDSNGGGTGVISDVASADSNETALTSDSENVQLIRYPVLALNKFFTGVTGGNGNTLADAVGDNLNFGFVLANAGNVTLKDVSIIDPLTGFSQTGLEMAPGEVKTWFASYALTQTDIDNNGGGDGYIRNTATASSSETPVITDTESVSVSRFIGMGFNKTFTGVTGGNGNALADAEGDVLNFSFTINNPGNVTLTEVSLVDVLTKLSLSGISIDPGTTNTYTASYTLTQEDLDNKGNGAGTLDNVAAADSKETDTVVDNELVTLIYQPMIDLTKSVSTDNGVTWEDANSPTGPILLSDAGFGPLYKFLVVNTGNITLAGVEVNDSAYDLNGSDPGTAHVFVDLAPGESAEWVFSGATWAEGQQTDVAIASVVGLPGVTDTDNAYYLGVLAA